MKKVIGVVIVILLAGCGEAASSPADENAETVAQSVIDRDFETTFLNSTEDYQAKLLEEDPTLEDKSLQEMEEMDIFSEGAYEKMIDRGDYIIGAHYGFEEEESFVLYYVEGFMKGTRHEVMFTLDSNGEIVNYEGWPHRLTGDQEDRYINDILNKEDDTAILDQGGAYEGES